MNKLNLLILAILYILVLSKEESNKARMECQLLNRSYYRCIWFTRNKCCHEAKGCGMTKNLRKCTRDFHFLKLKLQEEIEKELEKENLEYSKIK